MRRPLLIGLLVGAGILLLGSTRLFWHLHDPSRPSHLGDGYYGVFLSNGQVYFGTIERETRNELILRHIFYVQVKGATDTDGTSAVSSDAALLKLGNELHGPEDWMRINPKHVLFIEKLKDNSKVSQAIRDYEAKQ